VTTTGRHRPKKKLGVDTSRRQEIWGGRLSLDGKHAAKRKFEDSPGMYGPQLKLSAAATV
jgi:hypothetical protein